MYCTTGGWIGWRACRAPGRPTRCGAGTRTPIRPLRRHSLHSVQPLHSSACDRINSNPANVKHGTESNGKRKIKTNIEISHEQLVSSYVIGRPHRANLPDLRCARSKLCAESIRAARVIGAKTAATAAKEISAQTKSNNFLLARSCHPTHLTRVYARFSSSGAPNLLHPNISSRFSLPARARSLSQISINSILRFGKQFSQQRYLLN